MERKGKIVDIDMYRGRGGARGGEGGIYRDVLTDSIQGSGGGVWFCMFGRKKGGRGRKEEDLAPRHDTTRHDMTRNRNGKELVLGFSL